jgi:hypothetical protein
MQQSDGARWCERLKIFWTQSGNLQVYIGNIDFEVSLKTIESMVRKYGEVADIIMKTGASTRAAVWLCAGSQTLIITRNLENVLIGSILGHQAPLSVVLAHARKI